MCIDLSALVQLTFQGDLEGFLAACDYTIMALQKLPEEEFLLALLETQLRKCKALGPAFVVFDGAEEGSKQRSSKFLYDAARQEVVRRNRQVTKDGLLNFPPKAVPGYPKAPKHKPLTTRPQSVPKQLKSEASKTD